MQKLIKVVLKPDMDLLPAIKVNKDTKFTFENENVKQKLENLVFDSVLYQKGENYTSEYHTIINLKENDILVFEENSRGYIKPVEEVMTVEEAIKELEEIKEV